MDLELCRELWLGGGEEDRREVREREEESVRKWTKKKDPVDREGRLVCFMDRCVIHARTEGAQKVGAKEGRKNEETR